MTLCAVLVASLSSGCLELGDMGGLPGTFDPVDEDFARPSPLVQVEGALQRSCEQAAPQPQLQVREQVFSHALCLCGDLEEVGDGLITRSSSFLLGSDPQQGHVGINGAVSIVGDFDVDGTLDVAHGLSGVGGVAVGGDLITGGDVSMTGSWEVGRDAWIDGDLQGVGSMTVGGDLYLTGGLQAVGSVDFTVGHRGFDYRGLPCACGASQVIDVAAEVTAHASSNDNSLLPSGVGDVDLVLESGTYYFGSASELVGSRSITVHGNVALYVDGDIETVGDLAIELAPLAELELWVAGTISTVGNLSFTAGDDRRPRAFRLFMGGEGASLLSVGNSSFVGAIYAPMVDIEYVGSLEVHGSLFANSLRGTGTLDITYDTDIVTSQPCADQGYKL